MGVSLGSSRVLRMYKRNTDTSSSSLNEFEVLLLPGSVYIQRCVPKDGPCYGSLLPLFAELCLIAILDSSVLSRDALRYDYDHSIASEDTFRGLNVPRGQRLSIMMRVRISPRYMLTFEKMTV